VGLDIGPSAVVFIQQQFQLDQYRRAIEYVLYFSSLFGFSCGLTDHRMPPQRQAVQRWQPSAYFNFKGSFLPFAFKKETLY